MGTLRAKFIAVATVALVCTMALIGVAINIGVYVTSALRADSIIQALYDNDGEFPPADSVGGPREEGFQLTEEMPFETRYFLVRIDEDGDVSSVDADHIASVSRLDAAEMAQRLVSSHASEGYEGDYRFRVFQEDEGATVIVLDCSQQMQMERRILLITFAVGAASIVVALAILVPLSSRATRPFAQNLARQRRFVTDASHELKTPLAIISANMDLMEAIAADGRRRAAGDDDEGAASRTTGGDGDPAYFSEAGEHVESGPERDSADSKSSFAGELAPWIESSKAQIARMDSLVKGMVELSRADEEDAYRKNERCDLGIAAMRAADEFAFLADGRGLRMETATAADAVAACSPDEADRILFVLLDNAVKYCDGGGVVRVEVRCRRKTVELSVRNSCETLRQEDVPHMFERFWRADASRSRETGGFGIGLATVKAIVERRGGKATASLDSGVVSIAVTLPAPKRSG